MITSKNLYQKAPKGEYAKPDPEELRDDEIVQKLQEVQKLFLPGSEPYYKVQDIISQLQTK